MDSIKMYNVLPILLISFKMTVVYTSCQNKYVINRGLTCSDKELILEMHNQLRQSVALGRVQGQPGASTMMLLSWDEELARKSQSLADTCHYGHDSNTARAVSRFYVGQNIATTWSTWEKSPEPDFASQITAWFNEVDTYSFNGGFNHATGHYSQMVWADTYLIGCGYNYFFDGYRYQKIYVCNYGPGGNVRGKTPYYPGSPACDEYGMISSTKYYGLCDSYRSFYPDYTCYRYRRSAAKDGSTNSEQIISKSAEISKNHQKTKNLNNNVQVKKISKSVEIAKIHLKAKHLKNHAQVEKVTKVAEVSKDHQIAKRLKNHAKDEKISKSAEISKIHQKGKNSKNHDQVEKVIKSAEIFKNHQNGKNLKNHVEDEKIFKSGDTSEIHEKTKHLKNHADVEKTKKERTDTRKTRKVPKEAKN